MDDLLLSLKSKGNRGLIDEADIEVSADLSDCFLVVVSGSSNDVSIVVRSLPDQPANQSLKVSFTTKTGKLTKMEHYRLCLFPEGKSN